MGVELYKHNAEAYNKVINLFKTEKRVCVIHPTGCGKSFIGLKWLEDNRYKNAVFLAPTVTILRQITKHIESCGMDMEEFPFLKRYTYSKLSRMAEEEISELNPDIIVLDEFHRCGAREWSKGVTNLINNNPNAKVLGFSATPIRYLDEQRDMAEEIFSGNVASEIPLEDAMLDGILPIPTYINAIYSFKDDIDLMQERINKENREINRVHAQQYLDDAKKVLDKAEGLSEIFKKHMRNKSGKYIVFCSNQEHMKKMMEEAQEWFKGVNDQVDMYSMTSFLPRTENMKTFELFYKSDNDHLKLLFSIDMLNEGIHVPSIDGVIMLRPTSSPIIFKQQLGRALSVGHNSNPLVFDIVNNVQSCEMVRNFSRVLEEKALKRFESERNSEMKSKIDAFQISDSVREITDIFARIDKFLDVSWDDYYKLAVEYYVEHGNLLVPANYIKNGLNLGNWINERRKARKGKGHVKDLTPERIEKLNAIGMVWDKYKEQWEYNYNIVKEYYNKHGNLINFGSKKTDNKSVARWLTDQIKSYNKKTLSADRIKLLEQIGIDWNVLETRWQNNYELAKAYFNEHGSLEGIKDEKLLNWVNLQKRNKKRGIISDEKIELLEQIGFVWDVLDANFQEMYEKAKKFYEEHGTLLVPTEEKKLAGWISERRKAYKKGLLSGERIKILEEIGMIWSVEEYNWNLMYNEAINFYKEHGHLKVKGEANKKLRQWIYNQKMQVKKEDSLKEKREEIVRLSAIKISPKNEPHKPTREEVWNEYFEQAKRYFEENGDLLVPKHKSNLGNWIALQRTRYKGTGTGAKLTDKQIERLESIGMVWNPVQYQWDTMYLQAKEYYEKYGSLSIPDSKESEFKKLRSWIQEQKAKYNGIRSANLSEDQIKKLEQIGFVWNRLQDDWEKMFEKAKRYFEENGDLLVPKKDKELGAWIGMQRQRYLGNGGRTELTQDQIKKLESIGMVWNSKQYKWNLMYSQAKAYYEEHGNLSFPKDNPEYKKLDNWITNRKQGYLGKNSCKLTDEQVRLLQAIGAIPTSNKDDKEESLEELEERLQGLITKEEKSSELLQEYKKMQKEKEAKEGEEK